MRETSKKDYVHTSGTPDSNTPGCKAWSTFLYGYNYSSQPNHCRSTRPPFDSGPGPVGLIPLAEQKEKKNHCYQSTTYNGKQLHRCAECCTQQLLRCLRGKFVVTRSRASAFTLRQTVAAPRILHCTRLTFTHLPTYLTCPLSDLSLLACSLAAEQHRATQSCL